MQLLFLHAFEQSLNLPRVHIRTGARGLEPGDLRCVNRCAMKHRVGKGQESKHEQSPRRKKVYVLHQSPRKSHQCHSLQRQKCDSNSLLDKSVSVCESAEAYLTQKPHSLILAVHHTLGAGHTHSVAPSPHHDRSVSRLEKV